MRTPAFDALLNEMEQTQKHALEQFASNHQDLLWDGGKINTWPLRVSIKKNNRSIAAINTRRKEAYLRKNRINNLTFEMITSFELHIILIFS